MINASKQKLNIDKLKSKKIFTSNLDNFEQEELPILIPEAKISTLAIKKVDITIIDADAYYVAYKLKRAWIFAISTRNLEYHAKKKARPKTNSKIVVLEKYHDFSNIFFKKNLDTFLSHQKFNHKILLKKEQKHSHVMLYKILP